MKKSAILVTLLLATSSIVTHNSQPKAADSPATGLTESIKTQVMSDSNGFSVTGGPSIHFPEPSYDFGVIDEGVSVSHTFIVQNTGDLPLKLIRAKAS
jgi:hypothetical protein